MKKFIRTLVSFFVLASLNLFPNFLFSQATLRLYLCNPFEVGSFPDLSKFPETSGSQHEWIFSPGHSVMRWDGYILQDNINGKQFKVHINCAEATPWPQQLFYATISIGGKTVLNQSFYVSGNNYQYYPAPFSFTSDTLVNGFAGEEVKLNVISMVSSGISGISWGSGIQSYIEIPGETTHIDEGLIYTGSTLFQNHPNPFCQFTEISYSTSQSGFIRLTVYDMFGREIKTLVDEFKKVGKHSIIFDASYLSNGLYYYCLQTKNSSVETKKMLLLR